MNRLWLCLGVCPHCQRNLLRRNQVPAWDSHHESTISPFPSLFSCCSSGCWGSLGLAGCRLQQAWGLLRGRHIAGPACWLLSSSPCSCNARPLLNHFSAAWAKEPITLAVSRMGYGISGIPGWASCVLHHTLMCFCVEGIYFTLSSRHTVFLIATCKQIQAKLIPRSAGYF